METKVNLATFDNKWFDPGGNSLKRILWFFVNAIFFNSYCFPFSGFKVILLKAFGAKVGKSCVIKPSVNIKYPWKLIMGDNVWIGEKVWIDNLAAVTIRNNVCISQGAFLLCGNHDHKKSTFDLIVKSITLQDGAWVGAKSTVCPGVTLHEGAVLSVGSIASKDLERNSIYRGNPAVKVRDRIFSDEK